MISLPMGLFAFALVIFASSGNIKLADYFNMHSVIVVVGGTLAVLAIGTPTSVIKALAKILISLFQKRVSVDDVRDDLMKLADNKNAIKESKDPLINYAIELWDRGVDSNTWQALLSQYRDKLETDDAEAVSSLHNVVKYPPALGMMGTVMGMISLFANLGSSDKSALGPSLAVAMTATFYGLIMANGFLNPIADRVVVEVIHRKKQFGLVYEILTLVNRREPVSMIEEEINNREAA